LFTPTLGYPAGNRNIELLLSREPNQRSSPSSTSACHQRGEADPAPERAQKKNCRRRTIATASTIWRPVDDEIFLLLVASKLLEHQ